MAKMRKCRTLRCGARAVYPPSTHDYLIEQAFPRLAAHLLDAIKKGSREVDARYGLIPVTLIESNAPKHAMTPGTKIVELMSKDKNLSKDEAERLAREWARAQARKFVDANGERAKGIMQSVARMKNPKRRVALRITAYEAFGAGAHTLMDNVSPAHSDFKVFVGISNYPTRNLDPTIELLDKAATFLLDNWQHKQDENHEPSRDELSRVTSALRNFYHNVFGRSDLEEAVGR